MMNGITLRTAFCKRFGVSMEAFEEELLWQCFHQQRALRWGKFMWRLNQDYYRPDIELIRSVAECTSCEDVHEESDVFYYQYPNRGFWRNTLGFRLSGQRLVDVAGKLLGDPS